MSPENTNTTPKTCPTCGTRLSENATRCLVCGRTFTPAVKPASSTTIQNPKLPELKISLPAAIALVILVLGLGAALVFVILQSAGRVTTPTVTPTPTMTATATLTPSPTIEPTAMPTSTPEPPIEYTVKAGDFCSSIAVAYGVSIQSITNLNNLPPDCGTLYENQKLLIPRPTVTPTSLPTGTLSAAEATQQACSSLAYTVQENDTLSSISANYNISIESIKSYNALTSDTVFVGLRLNLPLCERRPTAGPTPTATLPPPYGPASLLLPVDGEIFTDLEDVITLQWSSVGTLRENETYAITVEDVTSGGESKIVEYTSETKFIVPTTLRPTDNKPHVFRWWVVAVRQTDTTDDGQPVYTVYGQISDFRVFAWSGTPGTSTQAP
jgi:LysM repeat protein